MSYRRLGVDIAGLERKKYDVIIIMSYSYYMLLPYNCEAMNVFISSNGLCQGFCSKWLIVINPPLIYEH